MQKRYLLVGPVLLTFTLQAYEMNIYNLCYHNIKVIITIAHDYLVGRGCAAVGYRLVADMVTKQWSESVRPAMVADAVARWLLLRS